MSLPFAISVLTFLKDSKGRHLLLRRAKPPNIGLWSPLGGKLDCATGESPFACAQREIREECGLQTCFGDLHLFGYIAERAYEGQGHWLMFLFDCQKPVDGLPQSCPEGILEFFERSAVDTLSIPEADRELLWPYYDRYREGFVALNADCTPGKPPQIEVEKSFPFIQK